MAWHMFHLQVDGDSVTSTVALKRLYDDVSDWVAKNKTRTVKICLLDGDNSHAVQWGTLHDVITFGRIQIKFRSQRDASLFKMFFSEHLCDVKRVGRPVAVILPIIRRAMPSIIAADIIGCSPMTGPVGSLFRLQTRYRRKKLTRKQKLAKRAQEKAERKAVRWGQKGKAKVSAKVVDMTFKEDSVGSVRQMLDIWQKMVRP